LTKILGIYYNYETDGDSIGFYFARNGVDELKEHYATHRVCESVPRWLRNLMWYLWESIDELERGDPQSFSLTCDCGTLRIEHSQKQPPYHKVIHIPSEGETICTKIKILKNHSSWIMMLDSEYEGGLEDE